MGIQAPWLRIAEAIGPDAFLTVWRIADTEPMFRLTGGAAERGYLQMRLRPFKAWHRYQRNRYIEALAGSGKSPAEIQEAVRLNLCEKISLRHISTLMNRPRLGGTAKPGGEDGDDGGGS